MKEEKDRPRPPRWASRLLKGFARPYLKTSALGDLEEIHGRILRESGRARADRWYRRQAVRSIPRLLNIWTRWSFVMLKSYLNAAWRSISRQKSYSLINIAGLAVGMACCLMILMYVTDELSYDDFHQRADRIYRANTISSLGSNTRSFAVVPSVFTPEIQASLPEIEASTRVINWGDLPFQMDGRVQELPDLILADGDFFRIFSYTFLAGDPATALSAPDSLVITEELARRFFGTSTPLGESLYPAVGEADSRPFRITGVIRDLPRNTHLRFKSVASINAIQYQAGTDEPPAALLDPFYCRLAGYFLFKPGVDGSVLSDKIDATAQEKWGDIYRAHGTVRKFFLLGLRDIHLRSPNQDEPGVAGNIDTVRLFAAVALLVMLIASFNFINLSTARSADRAREVGIRKVIGSRRSQLVRRFLCESAILSLAGFLIGLLLVSAALPTFNRLLQKQLGLTDLLRMPVLIGALGIVVLNGLVAGGFPAFVLSAFDPVQVLKGKIRSAAKNGSLRKILVVFQFSITIFLVVGVLTILRQLDFVKNKDLGFDKRGVAVITAPGETSESLRDRILACPYVESAAFSVNVPGVFIQYMPLSRSAAGGEGEAERVERLMVGYDFISTYGMAIERGRDFSRDFATDADEAVIVNRKAAEIFGWGEDVVGKILYDTSDGRRAYTIVGVVGDFHQADLKQVIGPVVLDLEPETHRFVSVRIAPGRIPEAMSFLGRVFREAAPDRDFDAYFIDDAFRRMYPEADRFSRLYLAFGFLAVFIACLGLFGLASFTAAQRTKEIGVRKVLGASFREIIILLSREFTVLVLAANLVAWPLAYIVMRGWLSGFAYRITLSPAIFLFAGFLTVFIALLTISQQSIRAAAAEPVVSLRYE